MRVPLHEKYPFSRFARIPWPESTLDPRGMRRVSRILSNGGRSVPECGAPSQFMSPIFWYWVTLGKTNCTGKSLFASAPIFRRNRRQWQGPAAGPDRFLDLPTVPLLWTDLSSFVIHS